MGSGQIEFVLDSKTYSIKIDIDSSEEASEIKINLFLNHDNACLCHASLDLSLNESSLKVTQMYRQSSERCGGSKLMHRIIKCLAHDLGIEALKLDASYGACGAHYASGYRFMEKEDSETRDPSKIVGRLSKIKEWMTLAEKQANSALMPEIDRLIQMFKTTIGAYVTAFESMSLYSQTICLYSYLKDMQRRKIINKDTFSETIDRKVIFNHLFKVKLKTDEKPICLIAQTLFDISALSKEEHFLQVFLPMKAKKFEGISSNSSGNPSSLELFNGEMYFPLKDWTKDIAINFTESMGEESIITQLQKVVEEYNPEDEDKSEKPKLQAFLNQMLNDTEQLKKTSKGNQPENRAVIQELSELRKKLAACKKGVALNTTQIKETQKFIDENQDLQKLEDENKKLSEEIATLKATIASSVQAWELKAKNTAEELQNKNNELSKELNELGLELQESKEQLALSATQIQELEKLREENTLRIKEPNEPGRKNICVSDQIRTDIDSTFNTLVEILNNLSYSEKEEAIITANNLKDHLFAEYEQYKNNWQHSSPQIAFAAIQKMTTDYTGAEANSGLKIQAIKTCSQSLSKNHGFMYKFGKAISMVLGLLLGGAIGLCVTATVMGADLGLSVCVGATVGATVLSGLSVFSWQASKNGATARWKMEDTLIHHFSKVKKRI